MAFQRIDLEHYPRRGQYEEFLAMKLSYSATVEIDVTDLRRLGRAAGLRAYPMQIWMLTNAAQRVPEFRMSRDDDGYLGVWDHLEPEFTVLNQETRTYSGLWVPYSADFGAFYRSYVETIERHADGNLTPQSDSPGNLLRISSIPWVAFTGFNLNLPTDFLQPILTIGKYIEREGRTFMPLAVQVHHAVCDGWHLGQYVDEVQAIADDAATWTPGPEG